MSIREGENANQPWDAELEAAIARAEAARPSQLGYEMDPERRLATFTATPERLPTDLEPPKPASMGIPWSHLKTLVAAILTHEAQGHAARGQTVMAEAKRWMASKLEEEAQHEASRAALAQHMREQKGGQKGAEGPQKGGIPGFDL